MADRLAIDGGPPVRNEVLPYGHQVIDEDDIRAVTEVLRGDWLTTGPAVDVYEQALAEKVGAAHTVAVNSGTAALHAAVNAAGVTEGDEVITSPITFAASANAVRYCRGTPVFADIEPDTGNIDPAAVEAAITPRTKAIVAVDFAGQPADIEALNAIAKRHGITVIEDAAQSLGATYCGRPVGSLAALTTFSTHPVKSITTGEGGAVTTCDDSLADRIRRFRNHGINVDANVRAQSGDWVYAIEEPGYNYRLSDVLCALGRSQLAKLDTFIARRRALARRYGEAFAAIPEISPLAIRPDRQSAWHLYVIRLDLDQLRVGRKEVFRALRTEGIGVNVHFIPAYWHPCYERLGYARGLCPAAEAYYERCITLPLWPGMSDADADDVIAAVRKVTTAYLR